MNSQEEIDNEPIKFLRKINEALTIVDNQISDYKSEVNYLKSQMYDNEISKDEYEINIGRCNIYLVKWSKNKRMLSDIIDDVDWINNK